MGFYQLFPWPFSSSQTVYLPEGRTCWTCFFSPVVLRFFCHTKCIRGWSSGHQGLDLMEQICTTIWRNKAELNQKGLKKPFKNIGWSWWSQPVIYDHANILTMRWPVKYGLLILLIHVKWCFFFLWADHDDPSGSYRGLWWPALPGQPLAKF